MLKNLIFAFQFLTIIPFKISGEIKEKIYSDSVVYFPLVGFVLGIILALFHKVLYGFVPDFLLCSMTIFLLVLFTGGLHLDGIADTADGFYAGKNREGILRIMRDSHIGTMGVIGIMAIILLKIGFLESLKIDLRSYALIIMPVLSRWSMVLLMFLFGYAHKHGKAENFFNGLNIKKFFMSSLITIIILILFFGSKTLFLLIPVFLVTCIMGVIFQKKINGITGDTIGAVNEINEVSILIYLYIYAQLS